MSATDQWARTANEANDAFVIEYNLLQDLLKQEATGDDYFALQDRIAEARTRRDEKFAALEAILNKYTG